MRTHYDYGLVGISVSVAFLGSYAAITACEQYRTCSMGIIKSRYFPQHIYLLFMSLGIGGISVWSMHFIGMSAELMDGPDGEHLMIRMDAALSITTLIIVLCFTYAGCYIGSHDLVFSKRKQEIVDILCKNAQEMSMKKVNRMTPYELLILVSTNSPRHLLIGGWLTGTGVILMHYIGMAALRFRGYIEWNVGIIAASIIIAYLASLVAFWILFRLLSLYPNNESLRVLCALTITCGVCGMHYTGMAAGRIITDADQGQNSDPHMSDASVALTGIVVGGAATFLCLAVALADLRYAVLRLSTELYKADALIKSLELPVNTAPGRNVALYISKRRKNAFSAGVITETTNIHHVLEDERSDSSMDVFPKAPTFVARLWTYLLPCSRTETALKGTKVTPTETEEEEARDELEYSTPVFKLEGAAYP